MKSPIVGTCKFCKTDGTLRRSHVIAELCYKPTYDMSRPNRPATKLTNDPNHRSTVQKGYREYLFCAGCEQRFSTELETPFAEFWKHAIPASVTPDVLKIRGFDYTAFKLFHWLNLWRASVATIPEFEKVNLGPYEEKLRLMLENHDAGPVGHYPVAGVLLLDDDGNVFKGLVTQPTRQEFNSSAVYNYCYLGVEWYLFLTDHPYGETLPIIPGSPQLDGTMLLAVKNYKESLSIQRFLGTCRR